MPFPSRRGGGGGGFTLGPAQNVFTGADRTAAETARDNYATANPTWLISYNDDTSLNIRLEFGDTVVFQVRNSGGTAWLDNSSATGVPGPIGPSGEGSVPPFASVEARDQFFSIIGNRQHLVNGLPVEVNTGITSVANYVWTGEDNPATYIPNDPLWVVSSLVASSGSLNLNQLTISNSQLNAGIELPNGTLGEMIHAEYNENGSSRPKDPSLGARTTLNINTSNTQSIADPFSLTYSTVGDNLTFDFFVIPAEVGRLRVVFERTDNSSVIFDEFRDFTQAEVDASAPVRFEVGNRYRLASGTELQVTFSGIQLRGGVGVPGDVLEGQTTIYFSSEIQPYTEKELARLEDIEHPVTLRRDMPSLEDSRALAAASLNGNSALWVIANEQLTTSNRADAMIFALTAGQLDADGNVIPTTPVAANTIRLRAGTEVRIFAENDFRVVLAPVLESDITNAAPPAGVSATITRFDIQGVSDSVIAGTEISGSQTFEFNVNYPEDINGQLVILQNGTQIASAIDPSDTTATATVTTQTLQDNQEAVFQIRGTTNENVLVSRFFRVRGHAPAEQLFFGLSSSNNPDTVDTSSLTSGHAGVDGERVTTGTTGAGQYFIILVPTDHDPVTITDTVFQQDVKSIFTRTADVRTIGTVDYHSYVVGPLQPNANESYVLGY